MSYGDPSGYAFDGEIFCPDCIGDPDGEEVSAVFESTETDSPSHCTQCGAHVAETLTAEGLRYVAEAIAKAIRAGKDPGADEWRADYAGPRNGRPTCADECNPAYSVALSVWAEAYPEAEDEARLIVTRAATWYVCADDAPGGYAVVADYGTAGAAQYAANCANDDVYGDDVTPTFTVVGTQARSYARTLTEAYAVLRAIEDCIGAPTRDDVAEYLPDVATGFLFAGVNVAEVDGRLYKIAGSAAGATAYVGPYASVGRNIFAGVNT